ncbi:MAG TPA: matrixin family metalloprotease [Candidatus Paceibacterota bacterium]|nr:matrixin family metalloprotease [Candidatus Paceibacterota bacterium]
MRKLGSLPFLLLLLAAAAAGFFYTVSKEVIPCVTPITFSLVSYDSRFGAPEQEIELDMRRAATVWNDALGMKALVEASGTPELPVSFVYDDTQATVDTIDELSGDIDTLKSQLTDVANQYGTFKKQYDSLNAKGQATQAMYDGLQTLYQRYEALRAKINSDVAQGQALPSGSVEEGLYTSDASGTRITIYAFQDKNELMRTLIHEFGHALGLGHVSNPDSIMYPSNDASQSTTLTKEDLAELSRACAIARAQPNAVLYEYEQRILHAFGLDKGTS